MARDFIFRWSVLIFSAGLSAPSLSVEDPIQQMRKVIIAREALHKEPSTHLRVVVRKEELKLIRLIGPDQDLSTSALMDAVVSFDHQSFNGLSARIHHADPFTRESFRQLKALRRNYLTNAYPRSPEAHRFVDGLVDYNQRAKRHNAKGDSSLLPYLSLSRESGLLISIDESQIPLDDRRKEAHFHFEILDARWELIQERRSPSRLRNCTDYL